MDSAGKEKVTKPAHGPPLQARVAAANGTVLAACKLLVVIILAHMDMNRGKQSKMNGGQELMWAVGMAKAKASRHTARRTRHCRQTQPVDSPPGTGLKETTSRWPASQQTTTAADDVGLPLAVQCR